MIIGRPIELILSSHPWWNLGRYLFISHLQSIPFWEERVFEEVIILPSDHYSLKYSHSIDQVIDSHKEIGTKFTFFPNTQWNLFSTYRIMGSKCICTTFKKSIVYSPTWVQRLSGTLKAEPQTCLWSPVHAEAWSPGTPVYYRLM